MKKTPFVSLIVFLLEACFVFQSHSKVTAEVGVGKVYLCTIRFYNKSLAVSCMDQ